MTQTPDISRARTTNLTTTRGAALYIGALLGPGLLLLPGLAAAEAGPASIVAWLGLLALSGLFAAVFSGLGRRFPQAGGIMGYVAAGLGQRAGRVAGWSFLTGVVGGAPIVCLIGSSYITTLTGGGLAVRAAVAALLLLIVLALSAAGLRASAGAQLVLVALLITVVAVAVIGSGRSSQLSHWNPFAPHGWLSVGHAATTLMLSFVGWEAVAPLTTRFANPSKQLPRVIAIALAVTTALYLGLAIATISVLGSATTLPLADLLKVAIGPAGSIAAAAAAVVLTVGAVNAYVNGSARDGAPAHKARCAGSRRGSRRSCASVPAGYRRRRAGAHHALRVPAREHGGARDAPDDAVPHCLPGQHAGGHPGTARGGPSSRLRRLARRVRDAPVLRLGAARPRRRCPSRLVAVAAFTRTDGRAGRTRLSACVPGVGALRSGIATAHQRTAAVRGSAGICVRSGSPDSRRHRGHGQKRQHGRTYGAGARNGRHPRELLCLSQERPGH